MKEKCFSFINRCTFPSARQDKAKQVYFIAPFIQNAIQRASQGQRDKLHLHARMKGHLKSAACVRKRNKINEYMQFEAKQSFL